MESFVRYLTTQPEYRDRVFVSNPPNAALLLWTNKDFLPNITGISIVELEGVEHSVGIEPQKVIEIVKAQLFNTIPVLYIKYDGAMTGLVIDNKKYSLEDGASLIANKFSIKLGKNAAKSPNNASQISDPFHIWSRDAFDGISVVKTDIDFLIIKENKVTLLGEIKRSNKVKVGNWAPYIKPNTYNDSNNYYILMSLTNLLKCRMITIHHEEMDGTKVFNGQENIDVFTYSSKPEQATLDVFASRTPHTTKTIDELLYNR